jgi:molybdopterin molybdotransferase
MINWREAQARILALAAPVDRERLTLWQAAGRWAAETLHARRTQPSANLSAMDGYAVRFVDLPGPWRVVGESAAGTPFGERLWEGEAVRIFTGAALPGGADAIVIQEEADADGTTMVLSGKGPLTRWSFVRRTGEDFGPHTILVSEGEQLTPARIALAAIGGHDVINARRRILVAIVSTGNELVPAGSDPEYGLPDSNGPMLAALLADLPVTLHQFGIVRDDPAQLALMLDAARDHDVIVTTGGASVGDHDLVRPVLLERGANLDFWKVAMRPGKPVMAGTLGNAVVLALPGNPVSAFVTAHLFLRPLIAHLSGAAEPMPAPITATLGAPLPAVGPRTDFVRMRWQNGVLISALAGDSGALRPLADAQVLAIRPAHAPPASPGETVDAIPIA